MNRSELDHPMILILGGLFGLPLAFGVWVVFMTALFRGLRCVLEWLLA